MKLTREESKSAYLMFINMDLRYLFMSQYRAYWLPITDTVPKTLPEEELVPLNFEAFSIISELVNEKQLVADKKYRNTLFGEQCYQVFFPSPKCPQSCIQPYAYSDEELNILRAITGEAPLATPREGGHPIKDISGLYDAEVRGDDDLTPYLDMDNYIPPHTVKERMNGLMLSTSPEGLKTYEWSAGDFGTEVTAHPEHRDIIKDLIKKGVLRLGPPQKDNRYKDGTGVSQHIYY